MLRTSDLLIDTLCACVCVCMCVALAALSLNVMGKEIRLAGSDGHHSQVEDALTALELVQYQLANGESMVVPPPDTLVSVAARKRLMVHRLPAGTVRRDVCKLFKPTLVPASDGVDAHLVKCVAVIDGRAAGKDEVDEIPLDAKKMSVSDSTSL
jgi:hypothetical protein